MTKEWNLPQPLTGAERQIDTKFSAPDALLRGPGLRMVFKAALNKGADIVVQKTADR
ncbi:hypothetical protein SAMN05443247_05660 [Bradyrhizobium erythrophlei]|nr:hypothetical protein SAMN05443247_05660 [Bradyrhizobium erythrophlei]